MSILTTAFLYYILWRCVSLLKSPCRHRYKSFTIYLFCIISMGIPVTLVGGDAALHVVIVVGLPVAPVEEVSRASVNPLVARKFYYKRVT
jgi:hypothetical protein